jgi:hypothetical protein
VRTERESSAELARPRLTDNASTPPMPAAAMSRASKPNNVSNDAVSRRGASHSSRMPRSVRTASTVGSESIACTAAVTRFASARASTLLLEEDAVNDAEDCRVRADAERERQHSGGDMDA